MCLRRRACSQRVDGALDQHVGPGGGEEAEIGPRKRPHKLPRRATQSDTHRDNARRLAHPPRHQTGTPPGRHRRRGWRTRRTVGCTASESYITTAASPRQLPLIRSEGDATACSSGWCRYEPKTFCTSSSDRSRSTDHDSYPHHIKLLRYKRWGPPYTQRSDYDTTQ